MNNDEIEELISALHEAGVDAPVLSAIQGFRDCERASSQSSMAQIFHALRAKSPIRL